MAEAVYKRTNFFDGQFLKQGEFLGMEEYHRHMRRRMLYVLFDHSGVVQVNPTDLQIEIVNAAAQLIRVTAGTALGMPTGVFEAKEIVLREAAVLDLNLQTPPLGLGDTGIVTIHYAEQPTDPSSEGGVTGDTRVTEQAVLTVHRTAPGPTAPNGEPYVRLGSVPYSAPMTVGGPRDVAHLRTGLVAATASIGIIPNTVTSGTSVTLALTSSGGLDLSTLVPGNIAAMPGITNVQVPARATSSATVTFDVDAAAAAGARVFRVTIGSVFAETPLTIQGGLQLSGFTGVNVPGDTTLEINGSGFSVGTNVFFTSSAGGLTTAVPVAPGNVTPVQLRIPMADIPALATQGIIRVVSGTQTVDSTFTVTPPATIATSPSAAAAQTNITITGQRFFTGTSVTLPGGATRGPTSATPFPSAAFGESLTPTTIVVRLVANAGDSGRVRVTTAGGTVQSSNILTVT